MIMKTELHTLAFGNPGWMNMCLPTLSHYAERNASALKIWGADDCAGLPAHKFIIAKLLRGFLEGEADWCVWIDADVWIHPEAPLLTEGLGEGFHARFDPGEAFQTGRWIPWCTQNKLPVSPSWRHRNVGVWACDRKTAAGLIGIMRPPFIQGLQEQFQLNWWLQELERAGFNTPALDRKWNSCVPHGPIGSWRGGWFIHLLSRKEEKLDQIRIAGGYSAISAARL